MNNKKAVAVVVGAPSLLVIFSVLCLLIFSIISLNTANAGKRLSILSAQSTLSYYQADARANELLAMIRSGNIPDGVTERDGIYSFSCEISDVLDLSVEVSVSENGGYKILKWQSIRSNSWKADDSIDVWDGES